MEAEQYLKRIQTGEVEKSDLETLQRLQSNHMVHVPFENLDVMSGTSISLDPEKYYEKVVENHRGGFCYELNGLFHWLLEKLGYKSHLIACTVLRPDGTWAKQDSHAAQLVHLDQPYLVDVGFGDSIRVPLPLTGETREDVSGAYRAVPAENSTFDFQRQSEEGEWKTLFRLDPAPKKLEDFKEMCQFNQTSPHSPFTQKEIVTIATLGGRVTLSGNTLTITDHGDKRKIEFSADEKPSVLTRYFAIDAEG